MGKNDDWANSKTDKERKHESNRQHLEEQLWYDIKKAKLGFIPSHTKLCDKQGNPIESRYRPDQLADYFEKINGT